ncbi:MAG TPA: hypothetical protein VMG34_01260 [Bacteroidota bacterium]|nr:hypothetical protein [Bacteroidota bacterium]
MAPRSFAYPPPEHEAERASNSYLMSLVVIMVGLPFPIVNVIGSGIYYLANRRSGYFVRWHCTHSLLAQVFTLPLNATCVYWTLRIVFGHASFTNDYAAYLLTVVLFNLVEFIATMVAAIRTRKGGHVSWIFFGPLTDALVKG